MGCGTGLATLGGGVAQLADATAAEKLKPPRRLLGVARPYTFKPTSITMVATFAAAPVTPYTVPTLLDTLVNVSAMLDDVLDNLDSLPTLTQHTMMTVVRRTTDALNNITKMRVVDENLQEILKKMMAGAPAGIHADWWRTLHQHAVVAYNIVNA